MNKLKIAILCDSACDTDDSELKALGLYAVRMPIFNNDQEYLEGFDIDVEDVKRFLRNGDIIHTSQVALGRLIETYDNLLKEYDQILHIPLSSGLSGMYETALMQAKNYPGRIAVADAKCACKPIIYLCLDALKLIDEGLDAFAVCDLINKQSPILEATLIPEKLIYLKNGGRISPAAAALANILKIVPILHIIDGKIDVYDKVRTEKKALQLALLAMVDVVDYSLYHWMIIYDERIDEAIMLQKQLEEITSQKVELVKFGAIILAHTGPGTLAIARSKKLIK